VELFGVVSTVLVVGVAGLLVWLIARQKTGRRRLIGLGLLAVWLVGSVPIAWEFDSPYVRYEQAVIACGHQPVIATNFAAGYTYDLPGDPGYGPGIFSDTYYCSAQDAEAAHYRRPPRYAPGGALASP
jgi:hypothetical protein